LNIKSFDTPPVNSTPADPKAHLSTSPNNAGLNGPESPLFAQLLFGVGRQWRRMLETPLAELGLTEASWVPLFHLHTGGDGISLKTLAQRVGLDSSTLVRVVDLLEAQGLLLRDMDPTDRRSKLLFLTAAGRARFVEVRAHLREAEEQLLHGLDAQLVGSMRQGMELLSQRLQAAARQPEVGTNVDAHAL
jgi:MarR family transcriptional regulator for hemolysin